MLVGNKVGGFGSGILIGGIDCQNHKALFFEVAVNALHGGHFGATGWTPTGPNIDEYWLTAQLAKLDGFAREGVQREIGSQKALLGCWDRSRCGAVFGSRTEPDPSRTDEQDKDEEDGFMLRMDVVHAVPFTWGVATEFTESADDRKGLLLSGLVYMCSRNFLL